MAQDPSQQIIILQDELQLYGNKKVLHDIKVTEQCITCVQVAEKNPKIYSLDFKDIIGCDCMKGRLNDDTSAYLTIYAYPHKKKIIGKKTARARETLIICFNRKNSFDENWNDVKVWKKAITALLDGVSITSMQGM